MNTFKEFSVLIVAISASLISMCNFERSQIKLIFWKAQQGQNGLCSGDVFGRSYRILLRAMMNPTLGILALELSCCCGAGGKAGSN